MSLLDCLAPDLVITDVVLPGMDGLEAFNELYNRRGAKVIGIVAGQDSRRAAQGTEWLGTSRTLHEPFTEGELIAAVQQTLASVQAQFHLQSHHSQPDQRLPFAGSGRLGTWGSLDQHCDLAVSPKDCPMARILIIDDDAAIRQLLSMLVASAGHKVLLAADGAEGLRLLREQTPDLVITDIVMPEKDGFDVLFELRSQKAPPKTIVMSGAPPDWMVLESAKALGARKTLAKPFTRSQLIETIDAVLAES